VLGLESPPRRGIVALVALVIVNVAVFGYLATRPDPADARAEGSAVSTPTAQSQAPATPDTTTTSPAASTATPVMAVYGDGYSAGSAQGGLGPAGWPALVAQAVGADLRLHAVSMSGFVALGTTGQDFADIVAANPAPDAAVTVIFGSRNDLGNTALAVGRGAAETFQAVRAAAPDTTLVVVGPAWSSAEAPADLYLLRDAVEDAALAAGATFLDPLAEGWFSEPGVLIAGDGISPTDAGNGFLASRITPAVQAALPTD
jgi:hypothetical protein